MSPFFSTLTSSTQAREGTTIGTFAPLSTGSPEGITSSSESDGAEKFLLSVCMLSSTVLSDLRANDGLISLTCEGCELKEIQAEPLKRDKREPSSAEGVLSRSREDVDSLA